MIVPIVWTFFETTGTIGTIGTIIWKPGFKRTFLVCLGSTSGTGYPFIYFDASLRSADNSIKAGSSQIWLTSNGCSLDLNVKFKSLFATLLSIPCYGIEILQWLVSTQPLRMYLRPIIPTVFHNASTQNSTTRQDRSYISTPRMEGFLSTLDWIVWDGWWV